MGRTNYLLKTLHFKRICPTQACTKPWCGIASGASGLDMSCSRGLTAAVFIRRGSWRLGLHSVYAQAPEGSLGGEDTTAIWALPELTTAVRDVYVLWLQRWRRGWSRSLPAVDAKWLAVAREEQRLHMIDRRRPRPWTHVKRHEIINQDLLIIWERCVLLVGYRGGNRSTPLCPLTAARSSLRIGYEVVSDQTRG